MNVSRSSARTLTASIALVIAIAHCKPSTNSSASGSSSSGDSTQPTSSVVDSGSLSEPDATAPAADGAVVASGPRRCGAGEQPPPRVAEIPDAPQWRVSETASSAGQPAPVVRACEGLATRATAARRPIEALLENSSSREQVLDLGRCHYVAGGAWVLEAGRARARTIRVEGSSQRAGDIEWTVAFVKPDGAIVRSTRERGSMTVGAGEVRSVAWTMFHDLDRTGAAEAGFSTSGGNPERGDAMQSRGKILAFVSDAIAVYAQAQDIDPTVVFDADGDGDPDIATPSRYHAANTCGPAIFEGPAELAVLESNGSFSLDGAVSREFVRKACENYERTPANFWGDSGGEAPHRVACLRYWGMSATDLARMIERDWTADGDDHCNDRRGTLDAARVDPRFRLTPACR
ncbi:MAG: hypothetical protein JNK05_24765 [Myxococcales bacterium]|nr:hypothetical protein [Myxococcales bacterium]